MHSRGNQSHCLSRHYARCDGNRQRKFARVIIILSPESLLFFFHITCAGFVCFVGCLNARLLMQSTTAVPSSRNRWQRSGGRPIANVHLLLPTPRRSGGTPGFDEWRDLDMDLGFVAELLDDLNFTSRMTSAISLGSRCSGRIPSEYWLQPGHHGFQPAARLADDWHRQLHLHLIDCSGGHFYWQKFIFGEPINPATKRSAG